MTNLDHSNWANRVADFFHSPSHFLLATSTDAFLADILHDIKNDKISEGTKVLLLSPLLEYPTLLCTSPHIAEQTASSLLDILIQTPHTPKTVNLKSHLMLSITSVLISTSCMKPGLGVAERLIEALIQTLQDTNDHKCGVFCRPMRAIASECLREFEVCYPGLLSQKLDILSSLRQHESSPLHQSFSLLYSVALKNAVRWLTLQNDIADRDLKDILVRSEGLAWSATENMLNLFPITTGDVIPVLPYSMEIRELKSVISLLLEESYLLTPICQASLLRELTQVVAMVQSLSPTIFKSQLLRLFGTVEISLLHAMLQMKGTFTDSLFTAEDENFLLKRLVGMAQHPLLPVPHKLFYIDCILHFPENRPICSSGEENLPVLVTPQMTSLLFPTVFNESHTMLSRFNLLCLVYLEAGNEEDKGAGYMYEHLMALQAVVEHHSSREIAVTYFRSVYIFLYYFYQNEKYPGNLIQSLCQLYQKHCDFAPHFINLAECTQRTLDDSPWPTDLLQAVQILIVQLPQDQLIQSSLSWNLKMLSRIANESQVSQGSTVHFLLNLLLNSGLCTSGNWRMGNSVLTVCRNVLQHPSLDKIFIELADLLQFMMLRFEDLDIQDHARFYYTLLTNLSKDKLASILASGAGASRTKVRSLSSIMAESEELSSSLTVHSTRHPVLQLIKVSADDGSRRQLTDCGEPLEDIPDCDLFKSYCDQFLHLSPVIILNYHLTFVGSVDPSFAKLFCIRLHFELTDGNYAPCSEITVPSLFQERKPHLITLTLKPIRPYPTVLKVCAVFTTEDGISWQTQLNPISVGFSEVFLSLPVPRQWPVHKKLQLFDQMWCFLSSEKSEVSATSRFCFEADEQSLERMLDLHLSTFAISKNPEPETYKVLVFLPPKFHILLQIQRTEDAVCVSIVTDSWQLLPFINAYLQSITSSSGLDSSLSVLKL
ncbi:AP-5 complex subunit beta-1 isoform X1 [Erpetoichthys calabaricus]|uniref:AP-5 complex subunit beta-1 isoform X1 n=2 Tax=Erpetoichthys calabaricus TaxID=27687 RepID=UPI0022341449|nr:AP-5 complex subunit beta-1 isoform X1 [Erpetoichthys calabaricus]